MKIFSKFLNLLKNEWPIIFVLLITLPLFFYKLGQTSLLSWDEAWYGSIAKNILQSGDWLNLVFNNEPYYDHPQAGFWLIAMAIKLFGPSEFVVRLPSALSGLACLFLVYSVGKELFGKSVGFFAALSLPTSFWFLLRSRSGDLDIFLTMFFLLSLFLAIKTVKNKYYFYPLVFSLFFLLLIKSVVPFVIFPVLLLIFWNKGAIRYKEFWISLAAFLVLFGGWINMQIDLHPDFLKRYLSIGLPQVKAQSSYSANFALLKEYLHNGIGKWFWPSILSLFLSLFWRQRRFYILSLFFIIFLLPFIFSPRGQIWHLIPLYPFMILALFGFTYVFVNKITTSRRLAILTLLFVFLSLSFRQIRQVWYQVVDLPAYITDEAKLSQEAGKYPYPFYIDGDFLPAAAFYSEKKVNQTRNFGLPSLFQNDKPFLLITYDRELENLKAYKDQYQVLKTDRDKVLILRKVP
ncbi:MAG: glycosyltransferase family 39 protein [bacterium]|nr:glycosyltransferase family 39 protein [bacterium]